MKQLENAGLLLATEAEVSAAQFATEYIYIDPELLMMNCDIDYTDPDIYHECTCYLIDNVWYYEVFRNDKDIIISECTYDMIEDLNEEFRSYDEKNIL